MQNLASAARLFITFHEVYLLLITDNRMVYYMESNKPEWRRVGETLRFIREARQVTQSELAEHANISQALISNIEAGRRGMTIETAKAVSSVLKVRPIVFINEDFLNKDLKGGAH